jgi:hypothetical protein
VIGYDVSVLVRCTAFHSLHFGADSARYLNTFVYHADAPFTHSNEKKRDALKKFGLWIAKQDKGKFEDGLCENYTQSF